MDATTLTDRMYLRLREDIVHGHILAGTKLKIAELKARYGVGATPLREALYRLSADGFVEAQGQRGFTVASMSVEELADITDMRVALEGMALTQSVNNGDDEWESRVVAAFHHLAKIEDTDDPDLQEWESRNRQFHLALLSCCKSRLLMRFYSTLYDQHKRYRNLARVERGRKARNIHQEHSTIYNAALARDIDALRDANERHIRNTADVTEKILNEKAAS
tara:strand:+ start:199008 stop:199670 length:663 start_codon:yes stop_codon:yes gene_type:complete